MGTKAHAAIKKENGYEVILIAYDGYLDHVGIMLNTGYREPDKVQQLINLGDINTLGVNLENTSNTYDEHIQGSRKKSEVGAFFRDVNRWADYGLTSTWEECAPRTHADVKNVYGYDYTYIFDPETKKWSVAYWQAYDGTKGQVDYDLDEVLHSADLLDQMLGTDYYDPDYKKEVYERMISS